MLNVIVNDGLNWYEYALREFEIRNVEIVDMLINLKFAVTIQSNILVQMNKNINNIEKFLKFNSLEKYCHLQIPYYYIHAYTSQKGGFNEGFKDSNCELLFVVTKNNKIIGLFMATFQGKTSFITIDSKKSVVEIKVFARAILYNNIDLKYINLEKKIIKTDDVSNITQFNIINFSPFDMIEQKDNNLSFKENEIHNINLVFGRCVVKIAGDYKQRNSLQGLVTGSCSFPCGDCYTDQNTIRSIPTKENTKWKHRTFADAVELSQQATRNIKENYNSDNDESFQQNRYGNTLGQKTAPVHFFDITSFASGILHIFTGLFTHLFNTLRIEIVGSAKHNKKKDVENWINKCKISNWLENEIMVINTLIENHQNYNINVNIELLLNNKYVNRPKSDNLSKLNKNKNNNLLIDKNFNNDNSDNLLLNEINNNNIDNLSINNNNNIDNLSINQLNQDKDIDHFVIPLQSVDHTLSSDYDSNGNTSEEYPPYGKYGPDKLIDKSDEKQNKLQNKIINLKKQLKQTEQEIDEIEKKLLNNDSLGIIDWNELKKLTKFNELPYHNNEITGNDAVHAINNMNYILKYFKTRKPTIFAILEPLIHSLKFLVNVTMKKNLLPFSDETVTLLKFAVLLSDTLMYHLQKEVFKNVKTPSGKPKKAVHGYKSHNLEHEILKIEARRWSSAHISDSSAEVLMRMFQDSIRRNNGVYNTRSIKSAIAKINKKHLIKFDETNKFRMIS